jgi:hypothetical protein
VSSELDSYEPLIRVSSWTNNVCTVGVTNFRVYLDPGGMETILTVDPDAWFIPRFLSGVMLLVQRNFDHWHPNSAPLDTLEGFRQFHKYCADELLNRATTIVTLMMHGFPYEVECRVDSPLVGWFLVLGVNRE